MATGKSAEKIQILPQGTGLLFRRLSMALVGLGLWALALASLLALLTFHSEDPGVNRAADTPVVNLLGYEGAIFSSFMLQSFGLASFLPVFILVGWGWRATLDRRLKGWWLNLLLTVLLTPLGAVAFAALPDVRGWIGPGVTGNLGGTLGLLVIENLQQRFAIPPWMQGSLAALVGLPLFLKAVALNKKEWRRLGQGFFAIGRRLYEVGQGHSDFQAPLGGQTTAGRDLVDPAPKRHTEEHRAQRRKRRQPPPAKDQSGKDFAQVKEAKPGKRAKEEKQGGLDLAFVDGDYEFPPLHLLNEGYRNNKNVSLSQGALEKNAQLLEIVLGDFGVRGQIVSIKPGPVVTRYDLEPAPGTKTSRVVSLADDIARSMSAISVRVAVVPGSNVIGIELPNQHRETVYIHEILASERFEKAKGKLPLVLGKDIDGAPTITDLARMPHLLVAGTTGSGKSVGVNAMILSLLYRFPPDECKFIMIDPKMLELSVYEGIPHLLSPVVTDPKKAVVALKWTVREMEDRYRAMSRLGVRNIDNYNTRMEEARQSGEVLTRKVQTGFDPDTGHPIHEEQPFDMGALPYIVVIVDEMADLMLVAGKEVEAAIQRLAQMARAAGIHLIMSTQRPSVDVITGTIKANFPTRISFRVTSKIDSRTILGEQGAEQLLGMGDMLFLGSAGRTQRVHGPFASDEEVEAVVTFIKRHGTPHYVEAITNEDEVNVTDIPGMEATASTDGNVSKGDELYDRAVAIVLQSRKISTSYIQRQLSIGYNRAATIIDRMENEGLISAANHVGKREILVPEREE